MHLLRSPYPENLSEHGALRGAPRLGWADGELVAGERLRLELQRRAPELLNPMRYDTVSHILRVGQRGRGLRFATLLLAARHRSVRQARRLMRQVERAMNVEPRNRSGEVSFPRAQHQEQA